MKTITPEILAIAETLNLNVPTPPGEERVIGPRWAAFIGNKPDPPHNVVQRLRLAPGEVEAAVAEVRALFLSRGRRVLTWEIGPSSAPPDLVDRLLALGMVPDDEPEVAGMVLVKPPVETPGGVTVRPIETFEAFRAHALIYRRCFGRGAPPPDDDEIAKEYERRRGREPRLVRYLAYVDGAPIAGADALYLDHAVVLCGGATLPEARGRGAYRALVQARWDEAVARGTPALVVQAGSMSRPILERLGFEEVVRVKVLLDRFG
jgi:GNAT superfamily N-acetyltransferase